MRNLCVYCGSSPGRRDDYVAAARAFARELVARDLREPGGGGLGEILKFRRDALRSLGNGAWPGAPQGTQGRGRVIV